LDFERNQVDAVLSSQLKDLHLFIDLHIAVLSSHTSVKHLIEKYVTIIALDSHF
jgi:hypothetical protein